MAHCMKAKVNKLEENSKSKHIREMFKGYQPLAYVIKKEDGTNVSDTKFFFFSCVDHRYQDFNSLMAS